MNENVNDNEDRYIKYVTKIYDDRFLKMFFGHLNVSAYLNVSKIATSTWNIKSKINFYL